MIDDKTTRDYLYRELYKTDATEPAVNTGFATATISAALNAVLGFFLIKFGVPTDIVSAIVVILLAVTPVVAGFITRSKVWSPRSVQLVADEAVKRAIEAKDILSTDNLKLIHKNDNEPEG